MGGDGRGNGNGGRRQEWLEMAGGTRGVTGTTRDDERGHGNGDGNGGKGVLVGQRVRQDWL